MSSHKRVEQRAILMEKISQEIMPTIMVLNPRDSNHMILLKSMNQARIEVRCAELAQELDKLLDSRWRLFIFNMRNRKKKNHV